MNYDILLNKDISGTYLKSWKMVYDDRGNKNKDCLLNCMPLWFEQNHKENPQKQMVNKGKIIQETYFFMNVFHHQ